MHCWKNRENVDLHIFVTIKDILEILTDSNSRSGRDLVKEGSVDN